MTAARWCCGWMERKWARPALSPARAEVMGPKFQWMATHPAMRRFRLTELLLREFLAMRILGAQTSNENGDTHFTIPAAGM